MHCVGPRTAEGLAGPRRVEGTTKTHWNQRRLRTVPLICCWGGGHRAGARVSALQAAGFQRGGDPQAATQQIECDSVGISHMPFYTAFLGGWCCAEHISPSSSLSLPNQLSVVVQGSWCAGGSRSPREGVRTQWSSAQLPPGEYWAMPVALLLFPCPAFGSRGYGLAHANARTLHGECRQFGRGQRLRPAVQTLGLSAGEDGGSI